MGTPLPSGGATSRDGSELDRLRARIARYFPVYETQVGPQSVTFAVHIDPATLESTFQSLADELWPDFYVPILRVRTGEHFIEVVRRPARPPGGTWINLVLLFATIASTVFTGALIWVAYVGADTLTAPDFLWGGLYFALPLMVILGGHELAHYVVARRYALEASLPYFMPIPPPFLFGTLGAFISIRQPFTDRKALFDIGAAGPLAGFVISIPVTVAGLYLSVHSAIPPLSACGLSFLGTNYSDLVIGLPTIWYGFAALVPGVVSLNPLALAGWVGIFVTAINLLPAGQLDGGHVWRALLGDRTRYLSYGIALFLIAIGFFFYLGWLIFAFLVIILGLRHPPPLNDLSPIGWRRGLVGVAVAAILITGFTLVPVAAQSGQIGFGTGHQVGVNETGYAIAGNLSVPVQNLDVATHGFVLSAEIVQVVNGTTTLNATQLATWAATSHWRFDLGGTIYYLNDTASPAVPGDGNYTSVGAGDSLNVTILYANTQGATTVQIALTASEVCAPSGSGPRTYTFNPFT